MSHVGQLIRVRRRELEMTQAKLSELSGVAVSHICMVEKGKRQLSVEALKEVAAVLQVPVGQLVDAVKVEPVPVELRDYFAGLAMQALIGHLSATADIKSVPAAAYAVADAMLKARQA